MTIDEKVELVRKALEKGANVDISYHEASTKEEAENFMSEMGLSYKEGEHNGAYWLGFNTGGYDRRVKLSAYYDVEEDSSLFTDEEFLVGEEIAE